MKNIGAAASRRRLFSVDLVNLEQHAKPLNPLLLGTSAQRERFHSSYTGCADHPAADTTG